jgi:hypothetical protein
MEVYIRTRDTGEYRKENKFEDSSRISNEKVRRIFLFSKAVLLPLTGNLPPHSLERSKVCPRMLSSIWIFRSYIVH